MRLLSQQWLFLVTKDSIKLDKKSVTVSNRGEEVDVVVTASGDYTAQREAEWLSVSGSKITVEPNFFEASRTSNVTFYCGSANATVVITQPGMGPKDVVGLILDSMKTGDWVTFWLCFDITDAQKDAVLAEVDEKAGVGINEHLTSYQVLSESIDNTTGKAVVKTKYIFDDGTTSSGEEWNLIKRDGRWRMPYEALD